MNCKKKNENINESNDEKNIFLDGKLTEHVSKEKLSFFFIQLNVGINVDPGTEHAKYFSRLLDVLFIHRMGKKLLFSHQTEENPM